VTDASGKTSNELSLTAQHPPGAPLRPTRGGTVRDGG
jgi:hypothetical protein